MALSHRLSCVAASLLAFSLAGCGGTVIGTSSDSTGSSGSSGDSGSSGGPGSSGGSGSSGGFPADSAWGVNMSNAGGQCNLMVSTTTFGDVDDQSIYDRVYDQMMVSGGVAKVACTVAQTASGFEVKGDAQVGYDALAVNIPVLPATASMASPAVGSVQFLSPEIQEPCSGSCNFFFSGKEFMTTPGKVWLSFTCAGLSCGGSPPTVCPVTESFLVFENCLTM